MKLSIIQNKIHDIGKIRLIEREVNLNADRKRLWLGKIIALDELFDDSVPLSVNYFDKSDI